MFTFPGKRAYLLSDWTSVVYREPHKSFLSLEPELLHFLDQLKKQDFLFAILLRAL
jgi:hypothetical protein